MNAMTGLWNRIRGLFRRGEIDRTLEEEMRFHLEMKVRANIEAGMPEEAQQWNDSVPDSPPPGEDWFYRVAVAMMNMMRIVWVSVSQKMAGSSLMRILR